MTETLRIGTWNTHHGAQPGQQPTDFDAYIEACEKLAGLNLDILGLQEVEIGVKRSERKDLTQIAADITGMTAKFSRAMWYHGGQTGHSLLVRGSIDATRRINLYGDRRHPVKIQGRPVVVGQHRLHWMFERRNILLADVTTERGHKLTVAHTHFGGEEKVRKRSLTKGAGALATIGGDKPLIYIGDWNTETEKLWQWGEPTGMELAWRKGIATCGSRHIDHGAFRGLAIREVWTERLPTSDHRALIVEVGL